MAFKALLRGFRDLSDGSNTAMLDITLSDTPDNPKLYRQQWGVWMTQDEYATLKEGFNGSIAPELAKSLLEVLERACEIIKSDIKAVE